MITKDMSIEEVIRKYPKTIKVFSDFGLDCYECQIAGYEDIAHGAEVHKIDLEKLLKELNESTKKV